MYTPYTLRLEPNPRTGPAEEPVTRTEAKTQARVYSSSEDTYVDSLIAAARRYLERVTGRQIVTATWGGFLDDFPADRRYIELPAYPLASVSFIKYRDTAAGTLQTWDSANYIVDTATEPGLVFLAPDVDWPDVQEDRRNAVEVEFIAGQAAASVPADIKHLVKILVAHWFENREPADTAGMKELPYSIRSMIRALKPRAIR
jgi:uncharacterized phiE125 gp8 family phage protein